MAFLPRPSSIGKFANSLPYRCFRPVRSLGCNPFFKKFPAPLRREFCCKPLNSLADWARKSAQEAGILQNSLFFSLLAGNFEVETGSIRAASTARQSVVSGHVPARRYTRDTPRIARWATGRARIAEAQRRR